MKVGAHQYSAEDEQKLMTEIWSEDIKWNPYNFVMYVFPWGKEHTPLAKFKGPRKWQTKLLKQIAVHIAEMRQREKDFDEKKAAELLLEVFKSAVVSGRGIGKSTFVSWLALWMMSCFPGSMTIITANTESQLKSKTCAELGKWHTLSINSHWFEKLAMSLRPMPWFEKLLKDQLKLDSTYYYAEAILWSEENPDAFAGAHNFYGTLLLMDEASGIPKNIWDVSEGFFTEPIIPRFWFVFSNGRRNTGIFYECFHKLRAFWPFRSHIDSRTVEGLDQKVLNDIIAKNGIESDTAKIEVLGQFPSQSEEQFISREVVEGAMCRELELDDFAPLVMGVDPARKGRDETRIVLRRGRDARSINIPAIKGRDNMWVANKCAEIIDTYNPDGVCIDAGNGVGIIDRLREMNYKVEEVWFGSSSDEPQWADKRTELWGTMAEWLIGGCLPNDDDLKDDLVGPEKQFRNGSDVIKLESKDDMRARGLSSPDWADALACTFFKRFARKDKAQRVRKQGSNVQAGVNYDPLNYSQRRDSQWQQTLRIQARLYHRLTIFYSQIFHHKSEAAKIIPVSHSPKRRQSRRPQIQ